MSASLGDKAKTAFWFALVALCVVQELRGVDPQTGAPPSNMPMPDAPKKIMGWAFDPQPPKPPPPPRADWKGGAHLSAVSTFRAVARRADGTRFELPRPEPPPKSAPQTPANPAWPPLPSQGLSLHSTALWAARHQELWKTLENLRYGRPSGKLPTLSLPQHADSAELTRYGPEACKAGAPDRRTLRDTGRWAVIAGCPKAFYVDCTHGDLESKPFYAY